MAKTNNKIIERDIYHTIFRKGTGKRKILNNTRGGKRWQKRAKRTINGENYMQQDYCLFSYIDCMDTLSVK
jgi:hypothetical protein